MSGNCKLSASVAAACASRAPRERASAAARRNCPWRCVSHDADHRGPIAVLWKTEREATGPPPWLQGPGSKEARRETGKIMIWIFWIFDFLRYLQKYSVFCLLVFTTGLLSLRPSRGYPYCILSPPAASDEFLLLRIPTPETPRRASTAAPSPPTAPHTLYINILDTMG